MCDLLRMDFWAAKCSQPVILQIHFTATGNLVTTQFAPQFLQAHLSTNTKKVIAMAQVTSTTRARAVKERQLAIVDDSARRSELQTVGDREIQVDDDWDDKLNLQVKIM